MVRVQRFSSSLLVHLQFQTVAPVNKQTESYWSQLVSDLEGNWLFCGTKQGMKIHVRQETMRIVGYPEIEALISTMVSLYHPYIIHH